jgi:Xaa-Pro dipeptidase
VTDRSSIPPNAPDLPTDADSVAIDERAREVARRIDMVRALVRDRGAHAALLRARRNFAWLTLGGLNHVVLATETGVAPILVTNTDVAVLSPNIEVERIRGEELAGLGVDVVAVPWWEPDAVDAEVTRRAGGSLVTDDDLEVDLVRARSLLGPVEEQRLAVIGAAVRSALDGALGTIGDGTTEAAAVAELESRLVGYRAPVLLAAADERIERFRHPLPTAKAAHRRLMLVVVAERWGLHVAATRIRELVAPDVELARRIELIRRVEAAMYDATVPGATLGDVFAAAQAAYADGGVPDEWRLHHQGGTIGYQGRERIAVPGDPTRIDASMAFAWNPSITGAKAEDTFVLPPGGERRVVTRA